VELKGGLDQRPTRPFFFARWTVRSASVDGSSSTPRNPAVEAVDADVMPVPPLAPRTVRSSSVARTADAYLMPVPFGSV
jgi:hypothetical protein